MVRTLVAASLFLACASLAQADLVPNGAFQTPYPGPTAGLFGVGERFVESCCLLEPGYQARYKWTFTAGNRPQDAAGAEIGGNSLAPGLAVWQPYGFIIGDGSISQTFPNGITVPLEADIYLCCNVPNNSLDETVDVYINGVKTQTFTSPPPPYPVSFTHIILSPPNEHSIAFVAHGNGQFTVDNVSSKGYPVPETTAIPELAGAGLLIAFAAITRLKGRTTSTDTRLV